MFFKKRKETEIPSIKRCNQCGIRPAISGGNKCFTCLNVSKYVEKRKETEQETKRKEIEENRIKETDWVNLPIVYIGKEPFMEYKDKLFRTKKCPTCEKLMINFHSAICPVCINESEKPEKKSRHIPERVRREVWRRDEGECVDCGSRERLEFDHIIPFAKGGSNTARNIELRCERCNRSKGDKI